MKSDRRTAKPLSWRVWLGLPISALFVDLALRQVDLSRMWLVIRTADPLLLSLVILLILSPSALSAKPEKPPA